MRFTKQFLFLFFFLILGCAHPHLKAEAFDLDSLMTAEEQKSSGLNKLTTEEKNSLYRWLEGYSAFWVQSGEAVPNQIRYQFSQDIGENPDDMAWVYTSRSLTLRKGKKYYELAMCAIFQNEAPYLKEWIEFHKLVGVQHFYLYNNLSSDNYMSVLEPYIARGEVDLIQWPFASTNNEDWNVIQCKAYENAIEIAKSESKWLAILDADEFLFPVEEGNLVDFLKDYEEFGGLCVNWQMYGTSGVEKVLPTDLMIEKLILKAPTDYSENAFVKSIVRPRKVSHMSDPHFAKYTEGYFQVNSDKKQISGSITPYVAADKIRINHYWTRDEWYFYNVKCARRQKWQEGYQGQINRLRNLNHSPDYTIQRFVPALKTKMGS
jgi:hypothetical protein